MKNENEIRTQFLQLCDKRLKTRYKKYLTRNPHNCYYGTEHSIVISESESLNKILCEIRLKNKEIVVCDADVCQRCKDYQLKNTKKTIEEQFRKDITNPQICGQLEPKIAMLLWVLQSEDIKKEKPNILRRIINRFLNSKGQNGSV